MNKEPEATFSCLDIIYNGNAHAPMALYSLYDKTRDKLFKKKKTNKNKTSVTSMHQSIRAYCNTDKFCLNNP